MKKVLVSFFQKGPLAVLLCAAAPATITHPWARATAPHQSTAAIYFDITPPADTTLISAASRDAAMAMLHQTTRTGTMSSMMDMPTLPIRAHQTAHLAPGGMHIMLTGLTHPLAAGGSVDLTLTFADGQHLSVQVPVQPIGALGPPQAGAR